MSPAGVARSRRVRLDELLVAQGIASTRAEAARLILAGRIRLPGGVAAKAGRQVAPDTLVEQVAAAPFVGRGGEKLAAALDAFGVVVEGRVCLDVGASTGGFTHCLLGRGACRVHAVDVGHGQLHPRIRGDARVVVWEGVNARHLEPARFPDRPTFAAVDVSFISLRKILPAVAVCLHDPAEIVALVKPQFEVGRGQVGKGGVVRASEARREAVRAVAGVAVAIGLRVGGAVAAVLHGPKGNREVFLHLARDLGRRPPLEGATFEAALQAVVPDGGADAVSTLASEPRSGLEGKRMRRIGVVARRDRAEALDVVRGLVQWLTAHGREVVVDSETAGALGLPDVTVAERQALPGTVDLIVVLGGDGTLLAVARLVDGLDVPILGVNLGGLGFLTATTLEALFPTLEAVLRGEYSAEERLVLVAGLTRDGGPVAEQLALNDVVVAKGALGRLIDLDVRADGQPMTAYRADGLIIATPTGSTAYNLSAAGPILFATMAAVVLTPICSHSLTNRPIVLPASIRLEVTLLTEAPDVVLSVDGQPGPPVTAGDVVQVRQAAARIRLIRDPRKSYFEVLRTKLKWGER